MGNRRARGWLVKWKNNDYTIGFEDDTGEWHTMRDLDWKTAKTELVRILGSG